MKTLSILSIENFDYFHGQVQTGVHRYLYEILPLLAQNFKVNYLNIGPNKKLEVQERKDNIKTYTFPCLHKQFEDIRVPIYKLSSIKKIIQDSDIVFSQNLLCFNPLLRAHLKGKPCFSYLHGKEWDNLPESYLKFIHQLTRFICKRYYNTCDTIFVSSKENEEDLHQIGVTQNTKLVPLAVNTDKFQAIKNEKLKKEITKKENCLLIGSVSRLVEQKNPLFSFQIFKELEKIYGSRLHFLFIGEGSQRIKKQIPQSENITYIPHSNQIESYYQAMDFFFLPSLSEASSLATMEAMSCGAIPFVSQIGGPADYIKNGINGFLFNPNNKNEVLSKFRNAIDNPQNLERISQKSRETIVKSFSWKKVSDLMTESFMAALS